MNCFKKLLPDYYSSSTCVHQITEVIIKNGFITSIVRYLNEMSRIKFSPIKHKVAHDNFWLIIRFKTVPNNLESTCRVLMQIY